MPLMLLPGYACEGWPGDVVNAVREDENGRPEPARFWVAMSMNWHEYLDFLQETFTPGWYDHPTPRESDFSEFGYETPIDDTNDDWEAEPLENDVNNVTSGAYSNRNSDSNPTPSGCGNDSEVTDC